MLFILTRVFTTRREYFKVLKNVVSIRFVSSCYTRRIRKIKIKIVFWDEVEISQALNLHDKVDEGALLRVFSIILQLTSPLKRDTRSIN